VRLWPCRGLRTAVRIPGYADELSANPLLCAQSAVVAAIFEHSFDDRDHVSGPAVVPTTHPALRTATGKQPNS